MIKRWFVGDFCPKDATCSLGPGALTPSNGPKIRTMVLESRPDQTYTGTIGLFADRMSFSKEGLDPNYWAKCEGQLLPIPEHITLFSIIGTLYGGDGRHDFGLPDLRSANNNNGDFYIYIADYAGNIRG